MKKYTRSAFFLGCCLSVLAQKAHAGVPPHSPIYKPEDFLVPGIVVLVIAVVIWGCLKAFNKKKGSDS